MSVSTSSKVPTDDSLADLLIGDSALLLYFSESRTKSRNSTTVPIFQNLSLFMCVLLCRYKVFLSIVAMIVMIKQDNYRFSDISKLRC